ncbi:hypothetical protein TNCV_2474071 [Trichonephila clavipes]|nr:hypothetical protein TNCV_2474071 [Trichonephila clavipes]
MVTEESWSRNHGHHCFCPVTGPSPGITLKIRHEEGLIHIVFLEDTVFKKKFILENNIISISEFGTKVNPTEIHLQLSKAEKTSKEAHIEYFYRIEEIVSRINMEKEAEKYYIIKGLKEKDP